MSSPDAGARELAAGLAEALRPALVPGAPAIAIAGARDVARLMGLAGLESALEEIERHGTTRPADVAHVAERVGRVVARAAEEGDLAAFALADRELGALAAQLADTDWSVPVAGEAGGPTLSVAEALADLTLDAAPDVLRARLHMTVASALRAAINWLGADEAPRVSLALNDSALALTAHGPHAGGVGPAGAVLASVEGHLGRETDGRWTLRVPVATERPSYLLLRQGRVGVAVPWHAVARLRMVSAGELERLEEPRLAPLVPQAATALDRPAALVALGLARAWLVADRIVWRISARPVEARSGSPFAADARVVELDGGERYWVLEPAWLLRDVALPQVAAPAPRRRGREAAGAAAPPGVPAVPAIAAPVAGEALAEAVERALALLHPVRQAAVAPPRGDEPATVTPHAAHGMFRADVDVLHAGPASAAQATHEAVVPEAAPGVEGRPAEPGAPGADLDAAIDAALAFEPAPGADVAPAAAPTARPRRDAASADVPLVGDLDVPVVPEAHPRPSQLAARTPVRRALVADDSLVARIFLARLLERRGWIVECVGDAAALWAEMRRGPWALVCADIALPDAQGALHVQRLARWLERQAPATPLIVLTRDADDERVALESGARKVLRKPFEPDRLDPLLPR